MHELYTKPEWLNTLLITANILALCIYLHFTYEKPLFSRKIYIFIVSAFLIAILSINFLRKDAETARTNNLKESLIHSGFSADQVSYLSKIDTKQKELDQDFETIVPFWIIVVFIIALSSVRKHSRRLDELEDALRKLEKEKEVPFKISKDQ